MHENKSLVARSQSRSSLFFAWVLPLCFLASSLFYVHTHINRTVTSDHASELVLGRLLAQNGGLLSSQWYYSTELRVFNTNLVYSFFFRLTDNWHAVRMLSYATMGVLLLVSLWLYGRSIGHERQTLILGSVLMLPFAGDYYGLVLEGGFYYPHLTILFLTLALRNFYSFCEISRLRRHACILFGFVLAALAGMGGLRQLAILYIPLALSDAVIYFVKRGRDSLDGADRSVRFSFALLLASLMGYALNSAVLSRVYSYRSYEELLFSIQGADRLSRLLKGLFLEFGFVEKAIFSPALLRNFIAVCLMASFVAALVYALRNARAVDAPYLHMATYATCAYGFFILLYMFTEMYYTWRFWLPLVVLFVPCLVHLLVHTCSSLRARQIGSAVIIACVALSSLLFYVDRIGFNPNAGRREVLRFLKKEGYTEGYATFWNANVLTELSNGEIEVWSWAPGGTSAGGGDISEVHDIDQRYEWLQLVEHDETHPMGRVFALFNTSEFESNTWCLNYLNEHIVFKNDNYVVLGYESHDLLFEDFYRRYEYDLTGSTPTEEVWVREGHDTPLGRLLGIGGRSWGPYITLPEGRYVLTIKGEGAGELEMRCTSGHGQAVIPCEIISQGPDQTVCTFELTEKTADFEVVLDNLTEENVLVSDIIIERNVG